ncbi:restriction endonuclease subunit S [Gelidibacter gilvus]|uniref:Restriction endonuclease subunit S n=1 Tax=Gelidibacter gilvus TaxID=59602 RepID=A0A4Q0XM82_9FLAO|nr:restriction endonuclease subunit S [Gelidibacter gilvus]RXJ51509.1 restriction endonuclease subunit S [Gelidibacter gilvus]
MKTKQEHIKSAPLIASPPKSKVQTYSRYKDSGVEWLGEIPEYWEVSRLKNHINMITGFPFKSEKYTDEGIKLARGINVKEGVLDWGETRCWPKIEDHLMDYLLKDGDILIAMDGSKVGKNFCQIKESDLPILLLQRVARLRPKKTLISNYLYNNIANRNFLLWVEMTKTDPMVPHIAPSDIKNFQIVIPPLQEQTAIANFLDDKTTKIDQAISIKEQQIALLKERKQIMIHKAVTRGLDDSVLLKGSGVEWIGEIPEHWEVKRLKFIFDKIQTGTTPSTSNQKFYDGNIDWYNPKDLNNEVLIESERKLSKLAIEKKEIKFFPKDSVLVVGIGATAGKTSYLVNEGTFNQQITGFHSNTEHNKYYFYLLRNLSEVMLNTASYTTLAILNNEFFKVFNLIKPPLSEQKEISKYIETASQKIDTAITLKQEEIAKLQEYKRSLINSVVTGKVKVC